MTAFLRYYFVIICCGLGLSCIAQNVSLKPPDIKWYIDTTGQLTLDDVQRVPFSSFDALVMSDMRASWNVWSSFKLKNETGMDKEFVLQVPKSGHADLFIRRDNTIDQLSTGSLLPLHKRSLPAAINGFQFLIRKGEQVQCWVKLNSGFSIYIPHNYNYSITSIADYEHADNKRLLWQGIFLGVIFVMIFYNLLIGIAVRDVNYFYYVLSIAGIGLYFAFYYGFGIEYLWKNAPYWDTFCFLLIVTFNGLTRLLFTRTYLHTPKILPRTNWLMNCLIGLNILLLVAGTFAYASKTDIIGPLLGVIGISNTTVHCLMLFAGIIAYYREKYQPAKFFIWANVVLVIGAVLFIGRELALLEDNFMTRYLVQIGFLIQVVVFSLGLASRLNNMRDQLAKETLEKERLEWVKQKNIQLEQSFALVKESENKQTQLNQIKDKLFSIISHDLRNPLATMQSFLKLITDHHDKLTEEEKEKLYIQAQQSLDHLNELMYNLLQWSRSQMNLLEFKQEKFQVRPLLESSARVLQLNAHMKNIAISIDADSTLCGFADKGMTEFVVRNLISNAIKFSHRNNEVFVKATLENGAILVEVKDHGVGMTEAKIKKLMEVNSTISRRGTEKEKGTGLGLLISKEFIEKNKGRLDIKSEPGKGSVFSFTIQSN